MMETQKFRSLRVLVITNLAILLLEFVFGISINIAPLASSPSNFSMNGFIKTLVQVGGLTLFHISTGLVLGILSIVIMILSLRTGVRRLQLLGSLAFLAILLVGIMGLLFVASGFRNQNFVFGIIPLFVLAVVFYAFLYFSLKPVSQGSTS